MALGKRKRRVLKFLGLMVAGLVAIVVALPVWLPWVLRPIAQGQGIAYSKYERDGYSKFVLRGAIFKEDEVTVRVDHLEAWTPTVWLWRWWRKGNEVAFARVNGWQVDIEQGKPGPRPASLSRSYRDVGDVATILKKWVLAATLSNGVVRAPTFSLEIPAAEWSAPVLRAQVGWNKRAFVVKGDFTNERGVQAQVKSDALEIQSDIKSLAVNGGLQVLSTNYWRSNQVQLAAQFGVIGMLPETASIRTEHLRVPKEIIALPGYHPLEGSVTANWTNGGFVLEANADAVAQEAETNLPPATVKLRARGNTNSAVVEYAFVSLPWLQAELSKDLRVNFTGSLLSEPAAFKITADLAGQPWLKLHGHLIGQADLSPGDGKIPRAQFQFTASNAGNDDLQAKVFDLMGKLDWPWVEVEEARAEFEDGSKARFGGKLDLEKKLVEDGRFSVVVGKVASAQSSPSYQGAGGTPGNLIENRLPPGFAFESLSVTGKFQGPLNIGELAHAGHLDLGGFITPQSRPVSTWVEWEGKGTALQDSEVLVRATNSTLFVKGSVALDSSGIGARLKKLTLNKLEKPLLELDSPCDLHFSGSLARTNGLMAQIDSFSWYGTGGSIDLRGAVQWPHSGAGRCTVENVRSDLFDDFLKPQMPRAEIRELNFSTAWTNGPVTFDLDLEGNVVPPKELTLGDTNINGLLSAPFDLNFKVRGDQRGITLSNAVVITRTSVVAVARGFLPATLNPSQPSNFVALELDGPLNLTASTQPHAFFWRKVADWTGLTLREPRLEAELSGTWKAPQGAVRLTANRIVLPVLRSNAAPSLENVRLVVELNRERAQITDCRMLLQGQPLTLTGEIPLGESFWRGLHEKQIPNWEQATARVSMQSADVAAFGKLLPDIVVPVGTVDLEASLQPGGKLSGGIKVEGSRLRPLPGVGAIRDIDANVEFAGRDVKLTGASGQIGGTRVNVTGKLDLHGTNWLGGKVPPFEVALKGTNVPLSRQPDSIVRSDLDLTIRKTNDLPPMISGEARLRDSYYLSDLSALMPGRVVTPEERPPYFSIQQEPLSNWRVDAHVTGSQWLRVRSTVFNGEVSANFRVIGTLAEPVALGDIRVDSGTIRFPFAALKVQQGFVTLSSQDPYHPQLQVSATSKEYGYDLTLQVTGSADAPVVQFTSVPPLSSEQIVLLVTAGSVPTQTQMSTQSRAGTMAVFLGRDLLSRLGFTDAGESRLDIHSGQDVTEEGKPTYNVEYRLNKKWSLVGEYDRFNAFNAGVKWKIYSK